MQENIDVTVELHDRLSRPAGRAKESVEDLRDEVHDLDGEMDSATGSSTRWERSMAALRRATGRQATETDKVSKSTRRFDLLATVAGKNVRKTGQGFLQAARGVRGFGLALKILKVQAVVLAVTLLAGALSAVGAAGFASVAGLAPLVGLLGVIPGLVLTAVSAVAAAKMGFSGIGDAVKALSEGDPEKIAEAMGKLTANGRVLATTLHGLVSGPLAQMKRRTQDAIAPGFTTALTRIRPLLPTIEKGLAGTARVLGDLASRSAAATNTPMFRGQVARVMDANNASLLDGGRAAGVFGLAMLNVADAFGPVQRQMAAYLFHGAEFLRQQTEMGNASGGLTDFFQRAWDLAKGVGRVLADVSVALYNTGVQASGMASMLGGSLESASARWRAWTESVEGRNAIRDWFTEAMPVVRGFLGLLGDLAAGFGGLSNRADLAPVIAQIRDQLVPALGDLSETASSELGPALVTAATAAVKFVTALSGSPLPEMLAGIATIVLGITSAFTSLPGPVQTAILTVGALLTVMKLLGITAAFLKGGAIAGLFSSIVTGAQAGMIGTRGVATAMGAVRGAAMGASIAVGTMSALLTGGISLAIIGITTAIGEWSANSEKAKQQQTDLKATMDQTTGAITDQTRALTVQRLEEEGVLKALQANNIDTDVATDALLGRADAQAELNRQLADLPGELIIPSPDFDGSAREAIDAGEYKVLSDVMGSLSGDIDSASASARRQADAMGSSASATGESTAATLAAKDAAMASRGALDSQAAATRGVITVTRELSGVLENRGTYVAFRQSVLNAAETLKTTTGALNANKTALNLNSQAGIDVFNTFSDMATSASRIKNVTQRGKAFRETAVAIRDWGRQAGLSGPALNRLVGTFVDVKVAADKVPKKVKTEATAETRQAQTALDRVKARASEVDGARATVTVGVDDQATGRLAALTAQFRNFFALPGPSMPSAPTTSGGGRVNAGQRREGGPVWPGANFTVGEVGPELFLGVSGKTSVIGAAGQMQHRFAEPGYVLPNEYFEAAVAGPAVDAPVPAPVPTTAPPPGGDGPTLVSVPVTVQGDAHDGVEEKIAAAVRREWRRLQREQEERG